MTYKQRCIQELTEYLGTIRFTSKQGVEYRLTETYLLKLARRNLAEALRYAQDVTGRLNDTECQCEWSISNLWITEANMCYKLIEIAERQRGTKE